nr:hypothetical protein [Tanacetum cinerariifolium]
ELLRKLLEDLQFVNEELAEYINSPSWNRHAFYNDDDDEYSIQISEKSPIAIAPVLPTEEPKNSLSMGDEHLNTIPETESNEVIKSSIEDHLPILSEFEGILDNICDVPFSDKNHFDAESDLIESLRTRDTSIFILLRLNLFSRSSPVNSFISIQFHQKLMKPILILKMTFTSLSNYYMMILRSPSSSFLSYSDNSLPEFKTFIAHTEETSSGSTTTHADNSLSEYDSFLLEIEPYQDSNFSSSDDSLGSGLEISFPSRTRNKIFDPVIFIEVKSERLLSREEFSISFIRDLLYPVFDTLLSFSFENEDKVFKPGILSYLLVSHRDKTTSDFSENSMMIYGGNIPNLDVSFLHFYPP